MPRDKNNVFNYTEPTIARTGSKITASWINSMFTDIRDAISNSLKRIGDTSFLSWIMSNGKGIKNINLTNTNSLLPVRYIQKYVSIIDVTTSTQEEITFEVNVKNIIILNTSETTPLSSVIVNFGEGFFIGDICVLKISIANSRNTIQLIVNDFTGSKPSKLLNLCVVFFQKFSTGFKVINTANFDNLQSNIPYDFENFNKDLEPLSNTSINFPSGSFIITDAEKGEFYLDDNTSTFNEGDIVSQVTSPVFTSKYPSGTINNSPYSTFFYKTTHKIKQGTYNRPANLFGGTKFFTFNVNKETNGVFSTTFDFFGDDNKLYIIREKLENQKYIVDNEFNKLEYNDKGGNIRFDNSNISYPIAKFGSIMPLASLNNNKEFEVIFNDISLSLNGLDIDSLKNSNSKTKSLVINNPILTFLDKDYKIPSFFVCKSTFNLSTINITDNDFQNYDYDENVIQGFNYLSYNVSGGIVLGYNCNSRYNDYGKAPLYSWSMPSSSLSNGYIKFTKLYGPFYKVTGNTTSKLNNTSGKPYGKFLNKNTYLNTEISGIVDLKNATSIAITSYNMDKLKDAGVKQELDTPFNNTTSDIDVYRPKNISELSTSNSYNNKTITIDSIKTTKGISCFISGNVTIAYRNLS